MLSEAKHLTLELETLRFAQGDNLQSDLISSGKYRNLSLDKAVSLLSIIKVEAMQETVGERSHHHGCHADESYP